MSNTVRKVAIASLLMPATLLASCAPSTDDSSGSDTDQLTVMAAASFTPMNDELKKLVDEKDIADSTTIVNGGSSSLIQQLADGAEADLLITADWTSMQKAIDQGLVSDPKAIADNRMVMVVPKGNPADVKEVNASLNNSKLVLCDKQVPCGARSEEIQQSLGLELQPVSLENSVSDVLGKVVSGQADSGWVYSTDAKSAGDDVEIIDIPNAEKFTNTLYIATVNKSDETDDATKVEDLLTDPSMSQVWQRYGFAPPTDNRR